MIRIMRNLLQLLKMMMEQYELLGMIFLEKKFNNNWGMLNGKAFNDRRNYYHKPVSNLNWDWKIDELSNLSTVIYASWGRGGGTGSAGAFAPVMQDGTGTKDYQSIYDANVRSEERRVGKEWRFGG